jgi:hypothetical protein
MRECGTYRKGQHAGLLLLILFLATSHAYGTKPSAPLDCFFCSASKVVNQVVLVLETEGRILGPDIDIDLATRSVRSKDSNRRKEDRPSESFAVRIISGKYRITAASAQRTFPAANRQTISRGPTAVAGLATSISVLSTVVLRI